MITPVIAELAVKKILIDGSELSFQRFAQEFQDFFVSVHGQGF
jgi:hypothetical protein